MIRSVRRPGSLRPSAEANKYRAVVTIVSGAMRGAARLTARGAVGAGAGYVTLLGDPSEAGPLDSIVHRRGSALDEVLGVARGVVIVGPGLGRDDAARRLVKAAIASPAALLLDGDALSLLGRDAASLIVGRDAATVLTPHEGEFDRMFGAGDDKVARTIAAANAARCTIVHKGHLTVIASPDARATLTSDDGSPWLATAGTGDVLAGAIAARWAAALADPLAGAEAGVWLHSRASQLAGAAFSADQLAEHLPLAVAECA